MGVFQSNKKVGKELGREGQYVQAKGRGQVVQARHGGQFGQAKCEGHDINSMLE